MASVDPIASVAKGATEGLLDSFTKALSDWRSKYWTKSKTPTHDKDSIFISHKSADGEKVKQLRSELTKVSDLKVIISENIESGDKWRERIVEGLDKSRAILLLYSNPDLLWDWCMFEIGIFCALNAEAKVFCMHQSGEARPGPLSEYQSLPLEEDRILDWLDTLHKMAPRKNPPTAADLRSIAQTIVRLFPRSHEDTIEHRCTPEAVFHFDGGLPQSLEHVVIQLDDHSAGLLDLAGDREGLTFGQFCDQLAPAEQYGSVWTQKFELDVFNTIQTRKFRHEPVYFRDRNGAIWRPIVTSVSKALNGEAKGCRIAFVRSLVVPTSENEGLLQKINICLRLGIRTRIEAVEAFKGQMNSLRLSAKTEGERKIGHRLISALQSILDEARLHKIRDDKSPIMQFGGPGAAALNKKYDRIRADFEEFWIDLIRSSKDDDASGDYTQCEKLIERLEALNRDYLELFTPQLSSEIERRLGSNRSVR